MTADIYFPKEDLFQINLLSPLMANIPYIHKVTDSLVQSMMCLIALLPKESQQLVAQIERWMD